MNIISEIELSALFLIKIAVIIFLFIYIIFSLIVVKQVRVMIDSLEVGLDRQVLALAYIHLIAAIVIFILSIFIL